MSDPIRRDLIDSMNRLARELDEGFNGDTKGPDRKVAFVLLTANFGQFDGGRVNYISNAIRPDIITMMKETIARFEGRYDGGSRRVQ